MNRVIGYVRVCSENQVEKDNSIRNQIKFIKKYCQDYDYELVDIFKDEGVSGLKKSRDGLNKMMKQINESKIDVVLVYSLSRLGRKLVDVISWAWLEFKIENGKLIQTATFRPENIKNIWILF